jgi:predicted nucleic acid-binding Zn finger protein
MYGVMPRAILDIFNEANRIMKTTSATIKMEISYYEIYNEQVNDLLARKKSEGENLKLREHPK